MTVKRLLPVALLAGLLAPVAGSALPARAAPAPLFPDLKTLAPRALRLDRTDVSVDGSGVIHNVLRFSNTVVNMGAGPLILDADIDPTTLSGPATQRVMADDGSTYASYPAGTMYWHAAHQHYHFDDWGVYQLWTKAEYDKWIASGRSVGQEKKQGAKTTSCVLDEEFVSTLPGTPYPGTYYGGCLPVTGHLRQVLSPGWGDTYDYYRSEQWIDLDQETLADGQYVLRSVSDPTNKIYESLNKADPSHEGAADNEAITVFTIQGGVLLDGGPPSGTISVNHVDVATQATAVSVDVLGRDDVSGVDQFRLSNDGATWTGPIAYTSGDGSVPTTVAWDLADARYGGNATGGTHQVFAQVHDRAGNWSATFSDSITLVTAPPPPTTGYGGTVAADGPVSYWRLGDVSGPSAADSIGTNVGTYRNGVVLGAPSLLTADPSDKAATFDGVNDVVSVPSTAALSPTGAVSVEAWVRPTAIPPVGAFASLVTKAESYSLQFNGPQLEFTTMQNGVRRRVQAPAGAVVAGKTYHVVGTYDGTTQRLYVNGAQVAWAPFTGALTATTNSLLLGSWDASSEFLAGTLDEVAVYAKPLTATQVANHYGVGGGAPPPPPGTYTLTVAKAGTGTGTVTSAFPVGINCGTTCSVSVTSGTFVTLTAAAASGSTFGGWSGGSCSGTASCATTVTANTTVTATFTTTAPPPSTGYRATVVADGPVSYWRLGETSGTVAADAVGVGSGTYRNGVALGAPSLLTSDTANPAATFDGVNDVVSVPSTSALSPSSAVTVEAWVRPSKLPAAGSFASLVTKAESYSLQFNGPQIEFTTTRSGTRRRVQAPVGTIVAGGTYHVVGTFDGTTQRLYVNGAQVASASISGAMTVNTNSVTIGSWNGSSEFLAGTLDEVAVYAKVLTPTQIANHYNAGKAAA